MRMVRRLLSGLGLALLLNGAPAQEAPTPAAGSLVALKIEPQSLEGGLNEFARQAGIQVIFRSEEAVGFKAPRLEGSFTHEAALKQLLGDSGLQYEFINPRTVAVRAAKRTDREQGGDSTDPSDIKLEEIVVTAQKRAERLFDVPMSIAALGGDELQKRKVTSMDELALAVPGVSVASQGGFQRRIALRGISNVFGNAALIGLYLDEASVTTTSSSQLDLRTYDLERVEVLRGPQGTLYGEGSLGGTVRFITRNPSLSSFDAYADVAALFTEDGEPGQRIEGAINVPLVEDKLGVRIAGTYDRAGGWIDQPATGRDDFNDQNVANARVKTLWQPTPEFAVEAMALVHRNDTSTNTGEDASGNFTQTFNLTTTPEVQDDYDVYNLTMTYDFAPVRVLSATSYINQDKEAKNFAQRIPVATPLDVHYGSYVLGADILTQELRFVSPGSGPWEWTMGGYYRHARVDVNPLLYFGVPGPPGTPLPAPSNNRTNNLSESWAVFANSSYELTERFSLGAGVRYFEDRQEFERRSPLATTPSTPTPARRRVSAVAASTA
jgi:iron complex outermembrane receptor protein